MKLTSVELENFWCFGRARFDLMAPGGEKPLDVVLLVGENGSGKTVFLQAVAGLFGRLSKEYGGPPLGPVAVAPGQSHARLRVEWQDWVGFDGAQGKASYERLDSEITVHRSGKVELTASNWARVDRWKESLAMPRTPTGVIVSFNVQHRAHGQPSFGQPDETLNPRSGALAPVWRPEDQTDSLVQRLLRLDRVIPLQNTLRQAMHRLFAPESAIHVSDFVDELFETQTGAVSLDKLSGGFRRVFVMVADLISRLGLAVDRPEEILAGEAVCLIDDFDMHLHPRLQEDAVPRLRELFPNVQFIATTHSPSVAGSVEPSSVFVLDQQEA